MVCESESVYRTIEMIRINDEDKLFYNYNV